MVLFSNFFQISTLKLLRCPLNTEIGKCGLNEESAKVGTSVGVRFICGLLRTGIMIKQFGTKKPIPDCQSHTRRKSLFDKPITISLTTCKLP